MPRKQSTQCGAGDSDLERRRRQREMHAGDGRAGRPEIALQHRDEAVLERHRIFLEGRGYRVRSVDSPKRLLELVEADHRFHLVVIDLASPCGEAVRVAAALHAIDPAAVLLGTGSGADPRIVVEFMRAGASDFLGDAIDEARWEAVLTAARGIQAAPPDSGSPAFLQGAMARLLETLDGLATTDVPILLEGETGVGKGLVARTFHARSARRDRPFVQVLCTAIPRNLLETELFGHARGAFTGATETRAGRFEQARDGILFLDEIGDLDPGLQAKLLHVLDQGEFTRVGCNRPRRSAAQVICATNRDLARMVAEGSFRRDLYHRINVVGVRIPPLRERPEEILPLFRHFAGEAARDLGREVPWLSARLEGLLEQHSYPGNVRELENLARRFVVFGSEEALVREMLSARGRRAESEIDALCAEAEQHAGDVRLLEVGRRASAKLESELIEQALIVTGWNRRRAARLLGMSYATLLQKIGRFDLSPQPDGRPA